jgi:hypothetical protein
MGAVQYPVFLTVCATPIRGAAAAAPRPSTRDDGPKKCQASNAEQTSGALGRPVVQFDLGEAKIRPADGQVLKGSRGSLRQTRRSLHADMRQSCPPAVRAARCRGHAGRTRALGLESLRSRSTGLSRGMLMRLNRVPGTALCPLADQTLGQHKHVHVRDPPFPPVLFEQGFPANGALGRSLNARAGRERGTTCR